MLLTALKTVLIVVEVLLIFNLMIIVHELGHFLAARWRGLVIEKFGIWFGKPIWKKTIGGVEYSLGSIPAGQVCESKCWGRGRRDNGDLGKLDCRNRNLDSVRIVFSLGFRLVNDGGLLTGAEVAESQRLGRTRYCRRSRCGRTTRRARRRSRRARLPRRCGRAGGPTARRSG